MGDAPEKQVEKGGDADVGVESFGLINTFVRRLTTTARMLILVARIGV
jgi:hypothetical protein